MPRTTSSSRCTRKPHPFRRTRRTISRARCVALLLSVPANIVEGSARDSEREFLQFLNIAYGSLAEVGYYIHLAKRLGYTTEDQATPLAAHHNELSRMLNGLMRSFQRHGSPAQDPRLRDRALGASQHPRRHLFHPQGRSRQGNQLPRGAGAVCSAEGRRFQASRRDRHRPHVRRHSVGQAGRCARVHCAGPGSCPCPFPFPFPTQRQGCGWPGWLRRVLRGARLLRFCTMRLSKLPPATCSALRAGARAGVGAGDQNPGRRNAPRGEGAMG
jgi:four helix bundle protein